MKRVKNKLQPCGQDIRGTFKLYYRLMKKAQLTRDAGINQDKEMIFE